MPEIYLEEKIGNPQLFTGRRQEMRELLTWIGRIKQKSSKSTALLARRKTGKTAILQRLYNLTFARNDGVIPFYYEVPEGKQWAIDFSQDFYLTFIFQYIGFKTRQPKYVERSYQAKKSFGEAREAAQTVGAYLVADLDRMAQMVQEGRAGLVWTAARDTPWNLAASRDERIVQLIDEFQFLNSEIYWDEAKTNHANDVAAGYMKTAEYRNAPLLISGSWVGWLMHDLQTMLPGRFKTRQLSPLPQDEAIEMVYRYALLEDIPVSEETAYLLAGLSEGNPFYISGLMRSDYPDKDLTHRDGVLATLEFETLHANGEIRGTWLEYIDAALPRINEKYAKDIVLYLCKHRDQALSRDRLKEILQIDLPDHELRKKLKALLRNDIIEEHYARYRGVQDNIFDKVFRSEYGEDIESFVPAGARNEYQALYEQLRQQYNTLSGEHNRYKGAFAEFMVIAHVRGAHQNPAFYRGLFHNLPTRFEFVDYESVLPYHSFPLQEPAYQIDLLARAGGGQISLIGEVKHRTTTKFSLAEAQAFQQKAELLTKAEQIKSVVLFVVSSAGFTSNALDFLRTQGIAWSDDGRWLAQ